MKKFSLASILLFFLLTPFSAFSNPWVVNFEKPVENKGAGDEGPRDILIDDMNNDGHQDVIVGVPATFDQSNNGVFYFMLGDGKGGFKTDGELKPASISYNDFLTGDFNNDGLRDIAISQNKFQYYKVPDPACGDTTEGVMIYLGVTGEAPTFNLAYCIRRGIISDNSNIASGDFNEDGITDMLVSGVTGGSSYSSLGLFYGNGDGTFSTTPIILGSRLAEVEVIDINGDGHLDILGKNFLGLLGNGDGTFTTESISLSYQYTTGGKPYVFADINGDGTKDLINLFRPTNPDIWNPISYLDVIYFDKFGNKTKVSNVVSSYITSMASGDLNGDSFDDLISFSWGSSVQVYFSTGSGNFIAGQDISLVEGPYYLPPDQNRRIQGGTSYFVVNDLNEDGLPDVGMLSTNPKKTSSLWVALQAGVASTVDVIAPTVSLTSPTTGSTLSNMATLSATAVDNVAVSQVDFFNGNALIGRSTGPVFTTNWDVTALATGVYILSATAFDAAGNKKSSTPVSVTVDNTATPPQDPSPFPAPNTSAGTTDVVGVIQFVGTNSIVVNGITVWITPTSIVKYDGVTEIAVGYSIDSKVQPNIDGSMTAIKIQVQL